MNYYLSVDERYRYVFQVKNLCSQALDVRLQYYDLKSNDWKYTRKGIVIQFDFINQFFNILNTMFNNRCPHCNELIVKDCKPND